ncbi:hypothetical protein KIM372_02260 [Bombiscardovia nodaiensis]|uniref:Uncharacterized protein n=1 Tax=Bombiscardovia nodaiensis TaxID=2932181 RepID=A0ABM8B658_9BIFI|nr:hypothetical protein KIM372_02260 [Bombiscardovia nodaiensis]
MVAADARADSTVPLDSPDLEHGETSVQRWGLTQAELQQVYMHNLNDEDSSDDGFVLRTPEQTRAFFDSIVEEELQAGVSGFDRDMQEAEASPVHHAGGAQAMKDVLRSA